MSGFPRMICTITGSSSYHNHGCLVNLTPTFHVRPRLWFTTVSDIHAAQCPGVFLELFFAVCTNLIIRPMKSIFKEKKELKSLA